MAPAGKVKRKNGSEALVAIRDKRNDEAPSEFISQVAAVSWAETQQPETRLAIQSLTKTAFLSANQVEVFGGESVAMATVKKMSTRAAFRHPKSPRKHLQHGEKSTLTQYGIYCRYDACRPC
jgi:hypothetical protein